MSAIFVRILLLVFFLWLYSGVLWNELARVQRELMRTRSAFVRFLMKIVFAAWHAFIIASVIKAWFT